MLYNYIIRCSQNILRAGIVFKAELANFCDLIFEVMHLPDVSIITLTI